MVYEDKYTAVTGASGADSYTPGLVAVSVVVTAAAGSDAVATTTTSLTAVLTLY